MVEFELAVDEIAAIMFLELYRKVQRPEIALKASIAVEVIRAYELHVLCNRCLPIPLTRLVLKCFMLHVDGDRQGC